MDYLWSPWRLKYITGATGGDTDCVFCNTSRPGGDDLILARGRVAYVILNLFPYNNGT